MSKAIITMGLPGSGKSYVINKHHSSMLVADCDGFKQLHPDYNPDKPELVHDWSKRCLEYMLKDLIESGTDFVYDSTGTDHNYILGLIHQLKAVGYTVELLKVHVNIRTALERNSSRERKVPEHLIHTKSTQLDTAFEILSQHVHTVKTVVNE